MFRGSFLVKEAQCCRVYSLHTSSGDSRVVPDQGAVLDIKEALLSESVFYFELYDSKKTRRGWLVQFGAAKE